MNKNKYVSSLETRLRKLEHVRANLADRVPEMLNASVEAYRRISEAAAIGGDPKAVASVQAGAKAALGNIETLIKLAEWALSTPDAIAKDRVDETERLLAAARAAMGEECGRNDPKSQSEEPPSVEKPKPRMRV